MFEDDRQPLTDDDDLSRKTRRDDFFIRRILKFAILGCAVILLVSFTGAFVRQMLIDDTFRTAAMNEMKDNAVGIALASLAILGINIKKRA